MSRGTTAGGAAGREPGGAARTRSRRNFAGSRPVMADVAHLAGVSKQTVSRVLNDHPAVRAETREAVLEAMRTLGYRPSRSARSLASGRTRMLGVISFDAARYGPASTLTAINTAAQTAGYLVSSIALDTADRDTVVQAVDRLSAEGADGIIAIAPQRPVATALAGARPDTPLVMLDNGLGDGTPVVSSDFTAGARLATGHLLDLGHPTVWHIAGPTGWTSADMRAASWRETLREAGARVHEPLVGDWSADSGYALGRRLAARPEVTAVFVSNDQMALGLLRALHEAGRRVPDDVSVVGYDDIPEAAHLLPPLTTIRTDFPEIGRRALRLLLTQLDDPEDAGEALERDPVIPVELIVRNSTGAAR
ncbi:MULTISPECIES: LacI family DNA-binding transcriptional regulator [Streptomyces]|uniref:LacI family DNA-binding transcriptional regulator n=1 Tax=Streptomyces caniscabiei TaxID=2746961 RepID=A0ABU4MNK4_9ACTN|nr:MULTISPECIES: LacI family DNA-binding transcriptional regulator [Streptomyces]MBE4734434.1 LacI family DNA-binding transcriptional regulator [Streptomyces caniscabiei]MBE4755305.1 LacI family DNA-binding transcriptional regulator [Streptomyces caniscabiei]MBE4771385.1 LacI family DNA-binding transcriptional regulator [Streptomyces caniscabiei]MBE4783410.1 LacI family DNA-binding transcriptional regulator [Streptomyces caniscabiei]MBE4792714.1 LacI family DNA-binding transcriptional regulato